MPLFHRLNAAAAPSKTRDLVFAPDAVGVIRVSQLRNLQPEESLRNIRLHQIRKDEITTNVKLIGGNGCPLVQWQRNIG